MPTSKSLNQGWGPYMCRVLPSFVTWTLPCSRWSLLDDRFFFLPPWRLWDSGGLGPFQLILISQCLAQCLAQTRELSKMLNDWMDPSTTSLLIPHNLLYTDSLQIAISIFASHPCTPPPPPATRSQCNLTLSAILVIFWAPGHFIVGPKAHVCQLWAPSCIPGLDRLFTESVPP